ncbi:uncharacterized protein LOC143491083 isoform X4 [Brachyhypopomus gauderio]|uniref:uncharacterized protein LOC143491083 isoform X4 n=1 Tax=Brachyhypopomus gauderio TaxID=698409 RepID=UPI004042C5F8
MPGPVDAMVVLKPKPGATTASGVSTLFKGYSGELPHPATLNPGPVYAGMKADSLPLICTMNISPDKPLVDSIFGKVSRRISACLADIASWMTTHHLKLNPSKTELLYIPGTPNTHNDLTVSFENILLTPSETARSLGVTLDNELSFSTHVSKLTRSCRFLLCNIRRIRPFLSQEATQVLVQSLVISKLDYCNSLLAGLPLRVIRPLQLIQNAAARLVFNLPKFSHVSPMLHSLHWLPVAARIRYKTLMLAYKAKNGLAPPYMMSMVKSQSVQRTLRTSSLARLETPCLKSHGRQSSRLFSVLAPRWWNDLPLAARTAESIAIFKHRLKTHLFVEFLPEY